MIVVETERLILREVSLDDVEFIYTLVNDEGFLRFIGDRGVRTLDDAQAYIQDRLTASYVHHGFGLYLTVVKATQTPIGICGLVKRDGLDDVDIGFAFLPAFVGKGYAFEAAQAIVTYARDILGLKRLVAITLPSNDRSIRLIEKLGLQYEGVVKLSEDEAETRLFGIDFE